MELEIVDEKRDSIESNLTGSSGHKFLTGKVIGW